MRKHRIAVWFLIGGLGIAILALMFGFERQFFVRGAWWTAIYVGLSLSLASIFCIENRDE